MEGEHVFKIEIDPDFKLHIELGGYERIDTLDKIANGIRQMSKMCTWMDDKSVPDADKDVYMPMFRNLIRAVSDLWLLLGWAGVTEREIREHVNIPF